MTGALSIAAVNERVLPLCWVLFERAMIRVVEGWRLTSHPRILFARSGFGLGAAIRLGTDEVTAEGALGVDLLRECQYEWEFRWAGFCGAELARVR